VRNSLFMRVRVTVFLIAHSPKEYGRVSVVLADDAALVAAHTALAAALAILLGVAVPDSLVTHCVWLLVNRKEHGARTGD